MVLFDLQGPRLSNVGNFKVLVLVFVGQICENRKKMLVNNYEKIANVQR